MGRPFLQNCLGLTKCQEPSTQSLLPETCVLSLPLKASPPPQGWQPQAPPPLTGWLSTATRPFLKQMDQAPGQDEGKRSFLCQEAKWHRPLGSTFPFPGGCFQPVPAYQMQRHHRSPASK